MSIVCCYRVIMNLVTNVNEIEIIEENRKKEELKKKAMETEKPTEEKKSE